MNLYEFRKQMKEAEEMELRNLAVKAGVMKPRKTVKDIYFECVVLPSLIGGLMK